MIKLPPLPDLRTRDGVKTVARFIVGHSASIVVVTLIKQNIDTSELRTDQKVGVVVGAHVLGKVVADATAPYVDKKIDGYADSIAEAKKEAEAEQETIKVDADRV